MHIHFNLGHIITKTVTLVTAGIAGFAVGGIVGAGSAMSAAVTHIAQNGLQNEIIHYFKHAPLHTHL
jgi:hypothetical protein